MKDTLKKKSGITLIALVITVIVLLILAGVSIAALAGQNGIITTANEAKEATEFAQAKEEVLLEWTSMQAEIVFSNLSNREIADKFEERLKSVGGEDAQDVEVKYMDSNETFQVTGYKGYDMEIQASGQLTTKRADAQKTITEVWTTVVKDSSLSTEEERIAKLLELLKETDASATVTKNASTGNIDIAYNGYKEIIDSNDNVKVPTEEEGGGPVIVEKAQVAITTQPTSKEVFEGTEVALEFTANVTGEPTYQWYVNTKNSTSGGTAIEGATENTYTVTDTSSASENYYYCEVTATLNGGTQSKKTSAAKVTVVKRITQVQVSQKTQTVVEGSKASLEVSVQGGGTITYLWYKNSSDSNDGGTPIDATQAKYEIASVSTEHDAYYYVKVTQKAGDEENTLKSETIKLNVEERVIPEIEVDKEEVTLVYGESTEVKVSGTNAGTFYIKTAPNSNVATASLSGDTLTIQAQNAGTTSVEVAESTGNESATVNITVNKVTPELTLSSTSGTVDYNATQSFTAVPSSTPAINGTLTVTSSNTNKVTIESGNNETATNNQPTTILYKGFAATENSTTITVEFIPSDTSNYNNVTKEYTVTEVRKIQAVNPSLTSYSGTYDGQAHTIEVTGATGETIQYSTDEGANKSWSTTKPTRIDAGTTTVYVRVEPNDNRIAPTPEILTSTITIEKVTPEVTLSSTYGRVNYNATQSFTVTPSSTPVINGTWNVTSSNTSKVTIESGNNETATNNQPTTILYKGFAATEDATTITVEFIPSDTSNYNNVTKEYTVIEVNKLPAVNPTTITAYSGTYDGTPHTIEVSNDYTGGTLQFSWDGEEWSNWTDTQKPEITNATPTPVPVYVRVKGDDNHSDTNSKSSSIYIGNETMQVNSGNYEGEYDEQAHTITLSVVTPSSGTEIYYSTTTALTSSNYKTAGTLWTDTNKPEQTDAGTTTVYWYVDPGTANSSNYAPKVGSNTITITKLKTAEVSTNTGLIYNGESRTGVTGSNVTFSTTKGTTTETDAGEYTAYATPEANYAWSDGTTGEQEVKWKIDPKSAEVEWGEAELTYNGSAQAPTAVAVSGIDGETLNLQTTTQTNAQTANYTSTASISSVTGGRAKASNYTLTNTTKEYKINPKSISGTNTEVTLSQTSYTYNGLPQMPMITVKDVARNVTLTSGTDYTVSCSEDITNQGEKTITIKGKGNYDNATTQTATYTIGKKSIGGEKITVTLGQTEYTYDGTEKEPTVTVRDVTRDTELTKDTDYTVSYSEDSINQGEKTVTVKGKGNYDEATTKTATYAISPKDANNLTIELGTLEYVYDGTAKTPTVTVKDGTTELANNTDYTYEITNNTNVGTATVTITGAGNYTGTKTANFTINEREASNFTIELGTTEYLYDGTEKVPTVTVKDGTTELANNTDYTYEIADNKNAGTATVLVTGKGNYDGTKTANFTINKREITVTSGSDSKTYDGDPLTKNEVTITAGTLATGHTFTGTANGTITEVGSTDNTVATAKVLDSSSNDVTDNYTITKQSGSLTITAAETEITFTEPGEIVNGNIASFTASSSPAIEGTWTVTSSTDVVTITGGNDVIDTSSSISYVGVNAGDTEITITFTPSNTNYSLSTESYTQTVQEANYKVGSTYYNTLGTAYAGASAGDTIYVEQSNTDNSTISIDKNVTLNLQANTATIANAIAVQTGGTLKIDGTGTLLTTGTSAINVTGGTLNVTSGNITGGQCGIMTSGASSTINIGENSGTVVTNNPVVSGGIYGILADEVAKWNFYNGMVKGVAASYNASPSAKRSSYLIKSDTAEESGTTYKTAYLQVLSLDANGCMSVSTTINGGTASSTNPTIPTGFKAVNTSTSSWGDGIDAPTTANVNAGLVIQDKDGNQFVWIPVDWSTIKYERHTYTTANDAGTNLADDSGWRTWYYRNYSDWTDTGGNSSSVAKYGGFYLARYEAGVPTNASFYGNSNGATYTRTTANNSGRDVTTYTPVSKANEPAWNFISQTNAKTVAAKMYNTSAVKSSLVDSYAWDTVTTWLQKSGHNVGNSTSWGNYYDAAFSINGLYALHTYNNGWTYATTYSKGSRSIANGDRTETATGITDRNKANNIYDFAGNMYEWTTETGTHGGTATTYAVLRGGCFADYGGYNPASYRSGNNSTSVYIVHIGFRVVLYLQ